MEKINSQLKIAMKTRDEKHLPTLRMLKSDLQCNQIDLGHELSADEIIGVLSSAAKKRAEGKAVSIAVRAMLVK
jgi:uncharacterized protein YqeY